jgi:cytochrome c oxidase subunit 4
MSTSVPPVPEHALDVPDRVEGRHEPHSHPSDLLYIQIALVLFVLTALEVSTYYIDFGPVFLPLLLIVMAIKFVLVVLFFMHLRFDAKIFGRLFWSGFFLAIFVYVVALSTFQFFVHS